MKTIYKYSFPGGLTGQGDVPYEVTLPEGAIIRHVDADPVTLATCLWCEVDTDAKLEERYFYLIGTGRELPERPTTYVMSYVNHKTGYVWHVYEGKIG